MAKKLFRTDIQGEARPSITKDKPQEEKKEEDLNFTIDPSLGLVDNTTALKSWEKYVKVIASGNYYYSSGFPAYDEKFGGIPKDAMITIAAKSGVGKSSCAIALASRMCKLGYNVLFFVSEEEIAKYITMFIAAINRYVNLSDMNRPEGMSDEARDNILSLKYDIEDLPIYWGKITDFLAFQNSIKPVVDKIRAKDKKAKIVIFIDYIGRLRYRGLSSSQPDKYMATSTIARKIRDQAALNYIPHIVLAQLNREGLVADTSEIERESSLVLSLYRPGYEREIDKDGNEIKDDKMIMYVKKNRTGPTGKMVWDWVGYRQTIEEPTRSSYVDYTEND